MVELVILACLASAPEKCDSFPVSFGRPMNVVECMRNGSIQVMQWAEDHPKWTIRKWRCAMPEA